MRGKAAATPVVLAVPAVLLLAALAVLSALAGGMHYNNLLLVAPLQTGAQGLDTENLEQLCEDEFLVTYEIPQEKSVRALNSSHTVTMIGTNAAYPGILRYEMLKGSFFTKAAWEAKSRHAVLNETAAFALFGSVDIAGKTLRIGGDMWLVVGVLCDGDEENAKLYAPSSVTGGRAPALLALMGGTVTKDYAESALKSLGVQSSAYTFYNLSRLAALFGERFAVAWKTALGLLSLLLAAAAARQAVKHAHAIQELLGDHYLSELLAGSRKLFLKTAGGILLFLVGIGTALTLARQILGSFLSWRDLPAAAGMAANFELRVTWLEEYHPAGEILFTACLFAVALLFAGMAVLFLKNNVSPANKGEGDEIPEDV